MGVRKIRIIIDDNHTQDVEPDGAGVPANATIALLWEKIELTSNFKANREEFVLFFRVNKPQWIVTGKPAPSGSTSCV